MVAWSISNLRQEATAKPVIAVVAAAGVISAGVSILVILRDRRRQRRGRRVCDLLVYPLKSGAEVKSQRETVTALGFEGDRFFQVTDATGRYVTPRDSFGGENALHPGSANLFQVHCEHVPGVRLTLSKQGFPPFLVDLKNGTTTQVSSIILGVARPNDSKEHLLDHGDEVARWLQEATGIHGARLQSIGSPYGRVVVENPKQGDAPTSKEFPLSLADEAPYLLTTTASLLDLKRRIFWMGNFSASFKVDMRRFRPNIVVDGTLPWEEDTWKRIRIGRAEFEVWQRCGRCVMTTIDRDTLKRDKMLPWLRSFRERPGADGKQASAQVNFGMHIIAVSGIPSEIAVGDTLEVLERDRDRELEWQEKFGPEWKLGWKFSLGLPSIHLTTSTPF
eukprot:TRINITY_DN69733_c0_g1_i1.p1 TRINITY_DN69733_c0_g1~~TRINITY_DN69733_c0_g1_i1.p1  ORF type:complete len:391 (-),score=62.12 TRINITY_DN69733_c0_g1_i1:67-1239(-)